MSFEEAVEDINNKVAKTMTDEELKEIYALYKQGTIGDVNVARPGMLDFKVMGVQRTIFAFGLTSKLSPKASEDIFYPSPFSAPPTFLNIWKNPVTHDFHAGF
jgi:hypothetical protein